MKWRLQFILLVLFTGCIIMGGIHLAERGIQSIDGIQNGPAQSFQITRLDNGKMEMTVLGRDYSIQEMPSLPVMQSSPNTPPPANGKERERTAWGNQIGQWLTSYTQKLTSWFAHFDKGFPSDSSSFNF